MKTGTGLRIGIAFLVAVLMSGSLLDQTLAQGKAKTPTKTRIEGRWQTFTGPEGEFKVDLPGKPVRVEDALGPLTPLRSFDLITEDGMMFSISLTDLGGKPRSQANNILPPNIEQIERQRAQGAGQRVVQIRKLAKNSVEVELRWREPRKNTTVHSIMRQTIRRGRLYHLACTSIKDGKDVDSSVCQRFFGSLRFTR